MSRCSKTAAILLGICAAFPNAGLGSTSPGAGVGAREEIEYLLTYLGNSGCRFYRNGSWHDAERAKSHLGRKYEYYLKQTETPSADEFIREAASKSSVSGEAYMVSCQGHAPRPSSDWFNEALSRLRASTGR